MCVVLSFCSWHNERPVYPGLTPVTHHPRRTVPVVYLSKRFDPSRPSCTLLGHMVLKMCTLKHTYLFLVHLATHRPLNLGQRASWRQDIVQTETQALRSVSVSPSHIDTMGLYRPYVLHQNILFHHFVCLFSAPRWFIVKPATLIYMHDAMRVACPMSVSFRQRVVSEARSQWGFLGIATATNFRINVRVVRRAETEAFSTTRSV